MSGKIFFTIFIICMLECNAENILVEITQGLLRGKTQTNRKGNAFYSFQSIPFARPPVGHFRFKAPVPADGWTDIRDATQDLPLCYQSDKLNQSLVVTEDCLYLNVYTSKLPAGNTKLKPVMFFVHGGGFTEGSGRQDLYNPEFLLTEDIVLVVTNYRLGIFGSFSIDDENLGVTGNTGLKDQVLALQWVRDNIKNFNGDPEDVTIFGESSGGTSVHLHVLSSMSAGLFKKAIAQSGIILYGQSLRNNGLLVANTLGVETQDLKDMLQTLQEIPAERILLAQEVLILTYPKISSPIVEIPSDEPAFLSNEPLTLIKNGIFNDVIFMIGYNNAEGIFTELIWRWATGESPVIKDFFSLIPNDLGVINGTEEAAYLSSKIKRFYYGDSEPSKEDVQPYIQIQTDISYGFPSYRVASEHVKTSKSPIYFYRFSADTKLNFAKRMDEISATYPGATHTDELGYLFRNILTEHIDENSVEDLAIDRVVTLWTNFAKYGTPTPENFTEFHLEPVSIEKFNYLEIGTHSSLPNINPDEENMQFWVDIYDGMK